MILREMSTKWPREFEFESNLFEILTSSRYRESTVCCFSSLQHLETKSISTEVCQVLTLVVLFISDKGWIEPLTVICHIIKFTTYIWDNQGKNFTQHTHEQKIYVLGF